MSLPRKITPAARARRALLFDALAAAGLTIVAVVISAGLGIAGAVGLLIAAALTVWIAVERAVRALRRRKRAPRSV